MKKLIIDRKTWYRGQRADTSKLLRNDGMRCCLGFYLQSCGMDDQGNRGTIEMGTPASLLNDVGAEIPEEAQWLIDMVGSDAANDCICAENSKECQRLMSLNDVPSSSVYPESDREMAITKIFAEHGIAVEFIN